MTTATVQLPRIPPSGNLRICFEKLVKEQLITELGQRGLTHKPRATVSYIRAVLALYELGVVQSEEQPDTDTIHQTAAILDLGLEALKEAAESKGIDIAGFTKKHEFARAIVQYLLQSKKATVHYQSDRASQVLEENASFHSSTTVPHGSGLSANHIQSRAVSVVSDSGSGMHLSCNADVNICCCSKTISSWYSSIQSHIWIMSLPRKGFLSPRIQIGISIVSLARQRLQTEVLQLSIPVVFSIKVLASVIDLFLRPAPLAFSSLFPAQDSLSRPVPSTFSTKPQV